MSIKVAIWCWDHSQHRSTELLMMLALADNANEQGVCWPAIGTLAKKTRYKAKRSAQNCIVRLEHSGEVSVVPRVGRSNVYVMAAYREAMGMSRVPDDMKAREPAKKRVQKLQKAPKFTPELVSTGGGELASAGGGELASTPEPSLTVNEPLSLPQAAQATKKTKKPKHKHHELIHPVKVALVAAFGLIDADITEPSKKIFYKVATQITNIENPVLPEEVNGGDDSLMAYCRLQSEAGQWKLTVPSVATRVGEWRAWLRSKHNQALPEVTASEDVEANERPFPPEIQAKLDELAAKIGA